MVALGTAFFFAFACGLLVEGVLAWRSHRVLRGNVALRGFGLGALGVITVLRYSLGVAHDAARQMSGYAVAVAFLACAVVDLVNRWRSLEHA